MAKQKEEKKSKVEPEEHLGEFETKLNKYGFIHISKRALPALPFKAEKTLTARIEGESLVITAATGKA